MLAKLCAFAPLRETVCFAWFTIVFCYAGFTWAENWDRFRGPNGAGQSDAESIPSEWTKNDYVWQTPLPGVGHSSPVIWGDELFITSGDSQTGEQILLAFDVNTGKQLWERRIASGTYGMHRDNSYATSTPAIDAEQLYMLWLDGDKVTLAAFTHDGTAVWRRPIGSLDEKHGFGTSPIVVNDMVIVINETEDAERSTVLGIDRNTGEVRWTQPRGAGKTSYATPLVLSNEGGGEVVVMSSMGSGVTAYDAATGAIMWQVLERDLPDRCVSSPIVADGLIIVSCGSGNNGMHMIALRPSKNGSPPEEAYRLRQGVPNIPTPVAVGDLLFLWHDRGTVSCLDAATGEAHWRKRVSGMFHSSPLRIGNRIFGLSREGEVVVLAAGKEYELIARNDLGERSQATPAVADGKLIYRTEESLICIGEKPGG